MRARIFFLLLAIAVPAIAFRARPVSDLRFEDQIPADRVWGGPLAAASDGTDYLILTTHEYTANIYAQVISQGVPYGPSVFIGHGFGGSVVWTGSEYLVAWGNETGVNLSAVSRRGGLLSGPKLLIAQHGIAGYYPLAVSNGREILVTVETVDAIDAIFGALVSLNGDPVGNEVKIVDHPCCRESAVTGTRDGFALALFGKETRVLHLDDAARPASPGGTLVEGPGGSPNAYFSNQGMLASDGTDVAVIFNSSFFNKDASPAYSLKSAVIDPTREVIVQAPRTLLSYGTTVGTVLWNGSEYVAAYSFAPSPPSNLTQVMLQRISRAGEPVDAPLLLSTVPLGPLTPTVVTSNGHEYLVTLGKSFVRIPIGSRNPTAPAELARLVDAQEGLAFARGRQDFLAVWRETDRSGATIRASRVDAKGRYLDGTGVVIATFPDDVGPPGSYVPATVSVDSDGQNWLVVWSYASHVWGCRVSAAGVMLDTKPIAIAAASGATVRWGGTSWLVVSTNTRQLATTTVTSDGLAGPVKVFDEISADVIVPNGWQAFYTYPLLAFDGEQFVFAAGLETYGGGIDSVAIVTERLGLSGDPIGGSKFILPPEIGRGNGSSLATNGSQDLIVFESWASGPSFQGLLLNRGHAPVTITIDAPQPIAWDTSWNGNEFIVAANTQDGGVQLKHLSRLGVARDTITLPRYSGEFTHGVVFPPSSPARPSTLAGSDLPLGLRTRHDAYAGVSREELAFAGDVADSQLQQVEPAAPVLIKAIGDPMGVTLSWQPQDNVLGFEIELRQSDGTDRVVGIAAGSTSSTHIAYGGLTGTTINLRAWNAAGLSAPSPDLQITTPRVRAAAK